MRRLLFILLLGVAAAANVTYYDQPVENDYPLFSSSFAQGQENLTTYHFRIFNQQATQASPFRIWLSSSFTWFIPGDLHYLAAPDGSDGNSPYWDMPPLRPNETAEVSFSVDRVSGLPNEIGVRAEPLDRWGPCELRPHNSSESSVALVEEFLDRTNRSQAVTGYYESGGVLLARLEGYGTFAAFTLNGSAAPLSSADEINRLAAAYADAATRTSDANLSMLHDALVQSKLSKARPERECYMLTGMDRNPCVDFPTCLYSCFSVQVCSIIGQSGRPFMSTIEDYNRSVYETNLLLEKAMGSSKAAAREPSHAAASGALADLSALNRAESRVIFHPLIMSYGFCEPPEYSLPLQARAEREFLDYIGATCAQGEKERIAAEALRAAPLLAPPPQKTPGNATAANATAANATKPAGAANGAPAAVPASAAPDWRMAALACACLFAAGFAGGRLLAGRR